MAPLVDTAYVWAIQKPLPKSGLASNHLKGIKSVALSLSSSVVKPQENWEGEPGTIEVDEDTCTLEQILLEGSADNPNENRFLSASEVILKGKESFVVC
jgi:hypothetical protein